LMVIKLVDNSIRAAHMTAKRNDARSANDHNDMRSIKWRAKRKWP